MTAKLTAVFMSVLMSLAGVLGPVSQKLRLDNAFSYILNTDPIIEEIFPNDRESALPQTVVYDIIHDHFTSELPDGKTEKKCIFIGYDGCRVDTLDYRIKDTGAFDRVRSQGSTLLSYAGGNNYPLPLTQMTETSAGWCSMITGEWGIKTGILCNISGNLGPDHPTLLRSLISEGLADSTAFYCSWDTHFSKWNGTYKAEKDYCEANDIPAVYLDAEEDDGTAANTIADLQRADCTDFIFLTLEGTDHAGHSSGFGIYNDKYVAGMVSNEEYAGQILDALEARATYDTEDWLVIMATDHGGFLLTHGFASIMERYTWIIANRDISSYLETKRTGAGGC